MNEQWRARLRKILEERGIGMKEVSLAAGLGETAVRDMLERGVQPKVATLSAVAGVLGTTLADIYDGEAPKYQRVKIIGAVSAGESWTAYDDGLGEVEIRIDDGEPVGLQVRGDSMQPVYRDGDVLIGAKHSGSAADNLIGLDCIVMTENGERFVKYVQRGTIRGRFMLRSYNPAYKDIENVKLLWAAPIMWIRRAQG